jgi:hypothetical protein
LQEEIPEHADLDKVNDTQDTLLKKTNVDISKDSFILPSFTDVSVINGYGDKMMAANAAILGKDNLHLGFCKVPSDLDGYSKDKYYPLKANKADKKIMITLNLHNNEQVNCIYIALLDFI